MNQTLTAIRVLCVDDRREVTEVMRLLIDAQMESKMICVGCLDSADRLVDEVRRLEPHPDVVLLDASMPGRDPFDAMIQLQNELPETRTIVFSGDQDEAAAGRALDAGAWGCVSKYDPTPTIMHAVREVASGRMYFPRLTHRAAQ
jgi:DNA-binding NarL/FixJ family response regulator